MSVSRLSAAERRELTEVAADFARRRLAPLAPGLDRGDAAASDECWAGIRELGLERALLPDELGGAGLAPGDLIAPIEELAQGDGGIALCVLLSNAALFALPGERAAAVPVGQRWAAVPVPDPPAAGSGALRVRSEAGETTVSGGVASALGAQGAEAIVLLADGETQMALVIPAGAQGCSRRPIEAQMGLRSARAADLRFEGVPVDAVAPGGSARSLVLLGVAAIARGIARRSYEVALDYAETRRQGGATIVEHGAVRSMLAGMAARLRDGGGLTPGTEGNAGTSLAPKLADRAGALAAKVRATDDALATAIDAVQVFGGTGYMRQTGVEKLMRDARYCQLYPEPNWVARDRLLDLERQ